MTTVTLHMAALILAGLLWRRLRPGGLDPDTVRAALAGSVYYLFLPALILKVLWSAPLGLESLRLAATAGGTLLAALALTALGCRWCHADRRVTGALLLAGAWPNATYMGLPVLASLFGTAGEAIAIQYDLFACTPLLLTLGVSLAQRFGTGGGDWHPVGALLRVPPLWAALAGVALHLAGIPVLAGVRDGLALAGAAVVPLMLFSLGLSLRTDTWRAAQWRPLALVAGVQLLCAPALALGLGRLLGLQGVAWQGAVLEAAMPSMVLGLVFCDRFGLDSALYAAAVTLTTVLSLATLPLWFAVLA